MTRIDTDWQIGESVSEQKIGPRLAQDWHGLARIDTDWHGLTRIGKLANLCRNEKLAPDWHQIGIDWHRIGMDCLELAWIGTDWQIGDFWLEQRLAPDWHRIGADWHGLARIGMNWHGLARIDIDWHGLAWIGTD